MTEYRDTLPYETPTATESDVGPNTFLVTCNHGWNRQKELAYTIRVVLAENGSNKKVRLLPDGLSGVVNTVERINEIGTPAHIFLNHLESGGYLFVASSGAYKFLADLLKAKSKSNLIDQLVMIYSQGNSEEVIEELNQRQLL